MSHEAISKATTPSSAATTNLLGSYPLTSVENAFNTFLSDSDFKEASEHLVTLMELLCSELPYSDFHDDLKQSLWYKTRTLRALLNGLANAETINPNCLTSK